MPTTEGYNGAFTGAQIDEAIGQVRGKNLPADGVKFTDGETFQEKYDSGELTGPQGERGLQGIQGIQGPAGQDGAQGPQGPAGADGAAATISVGTVTTGEAGTNAAVTNSGTSSAAVFNFTIPRGATGAKGDKGDKGDTGPAGADGAQGPAGAAGADGKSAYEYAQDAGYTGTEADLSAALASLGDLNSVLDTINGEVI